MHLQANLVAKRFDAPSLLTVVEDLWLHWLHLHAQGGPFGLPYPVCGRKNSYYPNPHVTLGILLLSCRWLRIPILTTTLARWANEKVIPFPFANQGASLALNYGWRATCNFPLRPETIRRTAATLKRDIQLELPPYLDVHLFLPTILDELHVAGLLPEENAFTSKMKEVSTLKVKTEIALAALVAVVCQTEEDGNEDKYLDMLCKTFDVSSEQLQSGMKTILKIGQKN